jgi:hypothetical protein
MREYDLEAFTPLSFPLSINSSSFPSTKNHLTHSWSLSTFSSLDLTSAINSLSSTQANEAKTRFRCFFSTFPTLMVAKLDAPEVRAASLPPAEQDDKNKDDGKSKKLEKRVQVKFSRAKRGGNTAEPKWLLISQGTDCSG